MLSGTDGAWYHVARREDVLTERFDNELTDYLEQSVVAWTRLGERAHRVAEETWRGTYGRAFADGRPRCRHGVKADFEYEQEPCSHYLIVPFTADVPGLPVQVHGRHMDAFECRGPLVPLGEFHQAEFFVSPPDLGWTMVHTHEDHALGGPYFVRAEWLPGGRGN